MGHPLSKSVLNSVKGYHLGVQASMYLTHYLVGVQASIYLTHYLVDPWKLASTSEPSHTNVKIYHWCLKNYLVGPLKTFVFETSHANAKIYHWCVQHYLVGPCLWVKSRKHQDLSLMCAALFSGPMSLSQVTQTSRSITDVWNIKSHKRNDISTRCQPVLVSQWTAFAFAPC